MRELRPHQTRAIASLREALRYGSKRPMLQAPTGAGKTVLAAALIEGALAKRKRVIFTVPAITLVDQTVREFYAEGIRDLGVIQADHPMTDPSKPVQIASMDTLRRREIPEADLVIIDEAHRKSEFLIDWMSRDEWLGVPFIGLSATPWTKGLGRLYDRLIVSATISELIKAGYLSNFRVFAPSHPDLTGVRTARGDFVESELSAAMQRGTLVADVVSTWLQLGDGRPTLCFAVDRVHAKTLQTQFRAAGVSCGYLDATTPMVEREAIRKQFQAGELRVVCNVGVLTTGVDWDVRCIVLARPTKSEILYTQIIGRGLRTATGKDHCLILDHSDTTLRLGFVTDLHHDRLDGGRIDEGGDAAPQERVAAKPRECPTCHYVMPTGMRSCPACGHVSESRTTVETVAGELVDLSGQRKANATEDWAGKVAFIAQVRAYAQTRGKSDGWVAQKYRAKFGVWPNDPRVRYAKAAGSVGPEVASWLKSQAIRYAKAMEKTKGRAA